MLDLMCGIIFYIVAYIEHRLNTCPIEVTMNLSKSDIKKRKEFIWKVLSSRGEYARFMGSTKISLMTSWADWNAKVHRDVHKLTKQYKLPVSENFAGERCGHCGKLEGTLVESESTKVMDLEDLQKSVTSPQRICLLYPCPCHRKGAKYCNAQCQKGAWRSHKNECTARVRKKKSRKTN